MTPVATSKKRSSASKRKPPAKVRGVYEKVPGSGSWWIQYFSDGKRKREKVGSKSAAIDLLRIRKADDLRGVKLPANLRTKQVTVSSLIDDAIDWYTSHKKPSTARSSCKHLEAARSAFGTKVAVKLTSRDVDKWIAADAKTHGWSPATCNRHKASLSRCLQLAIQSGVLPFNPARLVTTRKEDNMRVRFLSADEQLRMEAVISSCFPIQMPAFVIAIHTGMRQGEQFNLEWSRVDFARRRILITATKTGKDREVPLSKTALAAFQSLHDLRAQTGTGNKVFPATRYSAALQNPRQWFESAVRKAGVQDFHWHDCRHTFCSRLAMKGVPILSISKLAGHSSIQVTMRYAHLSPEHLSNTVELLD